MRSLIPEKSRTPSVETSLLEPSAGRRIDRLRWPAAHRFVTVLVALGTLLLGSGTSTAASTTPCSGREGRSSAAQATDGGETNEQEGEIRQDETSPAADADQVREIGADRVHEEGLWEDVGIHESKFLEEALRDSLRGFPHSLLERRFEDCEDMSARRVTTLGPVIWTPGPKPGSIDVLGREIKLSLLGYVKLDLMHDFQALGLSPGGGFQNLFITGNIPPEGTEAAAETGRTGFTANHTRFSVTMSTPTPLGSLDVFTQVQFNKNLTGSPEPYLRQGYIQLGNAMGGRAWSTFTPTAPIPFTLDYEGPNAIPEIRQALLRWTQPLPESWTKGLFLALAMEEPGAQLTLPADADTENPIPDFVVRLQYRRDWFNVYLSGVFRRLRATGGGFDDTVSAGGGSFSGSVNTIGSDNMQFGMAGGRGLGRYIQDMQGFGLDAAPTSADSTELRTIPVLSGWLGYQHWWTDRLRSTATYGHVRVFSDFVPFVAQGVPTDAGIYKWANYVSVNLVWSPFDPLDLGVEYLWGNRVTTDGAHGRDTRIQASAILYFGAST